MEKIIPILILVFLSNISFAKCDMFSNKNFSECLEDAKNGNIDSQIQMGRIYSNGYGVKKNHKLAKVWFKKAFNQSLTHAKQGDAKAQTRLGTIYSEGYGVKKNNKLALNSYNKCIEILRYSINYLL